MSGADGSQDWVAAGLEVLAEGGVEGVRIEVVAQRLGVTKGGFYRRYRDRRSLLDAMLADWVEGRFAAIESQTELAGETPQARLRAVVDLFAERLNAQGLSIELAIRQWARSDPAAAAAVARVDALRLARVSGLYERLGVPPVEAEARALIFYAYLFGQGLLLQAADPNRRDALTEACAEVLIDVGVR
ncbi:MAG TPA: TetR/AcrR family transcriptional regulator [Phenylobacterium sp.]|jgi:AcrR family transcriptional regulator